MSIKIIATDLDGTLMAADHLTVTQRTRNALLEAHSRGVKIAIATGRTLSFIDNVTEQIPFVDYVIYSNGASVFDMKRQKDIYANHISVKKTAEIIDFLNKHPVYYSVYSQGKIFVQKGCEEYYTNDDLPQDFLDSFMKKTIFCDDLKESLKGESSEIFAAYPNDARLKDKIAEFFDSEKLEVTSSLSDEVEATNQNVNKGRALKGLCDLLGINAGEAMSFGDAGNDCPMLEFAEYSFAMENATDICKQIAKYVAPSNADEGVAKMVEKYVL